MAHARVSVVSDTFLPTRDDRTVTARHVVDALIDAQVPVHVITASSGTASYRGAPVRRIVGSRQRGARITEALADFGPDVMLAITPEEFGSKALKRAVRSSLKTIVIEQRPLTGYLPASYVEQVIARASRFLVTSQWVAGHLGERGLQPRVWVPGHDLEAFHPRLRDQARHDHWARSGQPGGPSLVVGYVGELRKRHGVRRLTELADLDRVRPVMIGSGTQAGWLGDRLPEATFLDPMSTGALGTAIASLDVLVYPGDQLTCGHAVRAARAGGVPVVVARHGAAAEIVKHGVDGLLFDPVEGGLAAAVRRLTDPELRAELGAHAHNQAQRRPWSLAGDELLHDHLMPGAQGPGLGIDLVDRARGRVESTVRP